MSNTDELNPCPFCPCGGQPFLVWDHLSIMLNSPSVGCNKCGSRSVSVKVWNQSLNKEMRAMLEEVIYDDCPRPYIREKIQSILSKVKGDDHE